MFRFKNVISLFLKHQILNSYFTNILFENSFFISEQILSFYFILCINKRNYITSKWISIKSESIDWCSIQKSKQTCVL